jgi:hypothetical protein
MRYLGVAVLMLLGGCATAEPFVVSDQQRARFDQVVQAADAAAAADGPSQAAALVVEARSDFEYAQHLPRYPEKARYLADKAQHEADTALWMAQDAHRQAGLAGR